MKTFKLMIILSAIVLMTCSSALSKEDVQPKVLCCTEYLNPDGTANQATIEAAIDGGADPVTLVADLVGSRCELASVAQSPDSPQGESFRCCQLAPEFAVAVVFAAPNVNIGALTSSVNGACPDQAGRVTGALAALSRNTNQTITFRTTPVEDHLTNKNKNIASPIQ